MACSCRKLQIHEVPGRLDPYVACREGIEARAPGCHIGTPSFDQEGKDATLGRVGQKWTVKLGSLA